MYVYLITNTVNGKQYVGKTVQSIAARWKNHVHAVKRGSQYLLHRAIRKYGVENFRIDPLLSTLKTDAELLRWEEELISLLATKVPHGYNLTDGGEGISGHKMTADSIRKMSEAASRRKPDDPRFKNLRPGTDVLHAWRAQGNSANRGQTFSAEWRQNLSEAHKGFKPTPDTCAKLSASIKAAWAKRKAQ